MAKIRRGSRRRGKEERKKEKRKTGFSAGWRVSPAKVVTISFLGKSPDSRSVNARPLSSVKNRRDDGEGQRRCVSSNSRPCLLPKAEEEVGAETFGGFGDYFWTLGKKNQRGSPDSLLSRARRGWGEERKEFLTTPSLFLVDGCASCLSATPSASSDHCRCRVPGRISTRPLPSTLRMLRVFSCEKTRDMSSACAREVIF